MALYRKEEKGRALKTLAAAVLSYDWSAAKADDHGPWIAHVIRREAEALILPDLPAFLEGKYQPRDNDERLALLGVCQFKGLRAATANLCAAAFAEGPKLAEDLGAGLRYRAARAAAVAGCGRADGAELGEAERARWRRQARDWLRQDLAAWAKMVDRGTEADRIQARRTLARWQADSDLASLREPGALAQLPPDERAASLAFWQEVEALRRRAETAR
jgi:serine/threonine-protein kinase